MLRMTCIFLISFVIHIIIFYILVDINERDSNPCMNNASCKGIPGDVTVLLVILVSNVKVTQFDLLRILNDKQISPSLNVILIQIILSSIPTNDMLHNKII